SSRSGSELVRTAYKAARTRHAAGGSRRSAALQALRRSGSVVLSEDIMAFRLRHGGPQDQAMTTIGGRAIQLLRPDALASQRRYRPPAATRGRNGRGRPGSPLREQWQWQ